MKKCIKTLFLSIILVVMGGWYHSAHASDSLSKSPENWMSKLDESKHLTEINMPGSHDSGSFTLTDPVKSVWAKTQGKDYLTQMKSGVRFFDIRGRASADNMISVHHGMVYLHHELGKFLDDAKYYLSAYPNETIVMSMKRTTIAILKLRRHLKRFLENIIIITRNIRIFFTQEVMRILL